VNGQYFNNAGVFLVSTLFGLYILAVMLRFLLQTVRADFYNPLVQVLVKITNPLLVPLRRLIPGMFGLDMAAVALLLVLQGVELMLVAFLLGGSLPPATLLIGSIAKLLGLAVTIYFWIILIQVVLSWVAPTTYNPAVAAIGSLTEPLLRPIRRALPDLGGLDLSPLLVVVGLQLLKMLVVWPLRDHAGLPAGF
jgi:YggT family protein